MRREDQRGRDGRALLFISAAFFVAALLSLAIKNYGTVKSEQINPMLAILIAAGAVFGAWGFGLHRAEELEKPAIYSQILLGFLFGTVCSFLPSILGTALAINVGIFTSFRRLHVLTGGIAFGLLLMVAVNAMRVT